MRQIKFRGKRLDYGEWVYGDLTTRNISPRFSGDTCIFDGSWHVVDPKTIGQFTGLHDRHGREIYEGDIISPSNGLFLDEYSCVEWEDGSYTFDDGYPLGHIQAMEHTIVGNIHDNPELIN